MDARGGNPIVGERIGRSAAAYRTNRRGVKNREVSRTREVTANHSLVRYRGTPYIRFAFAEPFIVDHEEKFVLGIKNLWNRQRSIQGEAELIPAKGVLGACLQPLASLNGVVPQEVEEHAVILVGARLRIHVDLRWGAAKLSRVDSGLHLELLQCVDGRTDNEGVEIDVRIFDAIQGEAVKLLPHASDG